MKRFIDLGTQIYIDDESPRAFAFYCTVRSVFDEFNGSQSWESVDEFKADFNGDKEDLERYLNLIPKNWGVTWKNVAISLMGKEIKGITSISYSDCVEVSNLESDLIEALNNEDYELAAEIRDKIKSKKKK